MYGKLGNECINQADTDLLLLLPLGPKQSPGFKTENNNL